MKASKLIFAAVLVFTVRSADLAIAQDTESLPRDSINEPPKQDEPKAGAAKRIDLSAETAQQFQGRFESLQQQAEEKRSEQEVEKTVVQKSVQEYRSVCQRVRFLFRRRRARRIVVPVTRTFDEVRLVQLGIDWSDSRVGITRPEDNSFEFELPPTTGARLDFIEQLMRRNAKQDIEDRFVTGGSEVRLETRWRPSAGEPDVETRYAYTGAIVSADAKQVTFVVQIKSRPVNFEGPDDYLDLDEADATEEMNRLLEAIGL